MTTIEEAREALEQDIREAYIEMLNERKLEVWLADSMELADAYGAARELKGHVDACGVQGPRRCGDGWYCEGAGEIEKLGR